MSQQFESANVGATRSGCIRDPMWKSFEGSNLDPCLWVFFTTLAGILGLAVLSSVYVCLMLVVRGLCAVSDFRELSWSLL